MSQILLVGIGGFLGSICRFLVSTFVQQHVAPGAAFPIGTLAVNILGCLCIGLLHGLAETRDLLTPETRVLLMIGLLGGFTTYSTFGYETFALLRDLHVGQALLNILLHVTTGLLTVWAGYWMGRFV